MARRSNRTSKSDYQDMMELGLQIDSHLVRDWNDLWHRLASDYSNRALTVETDRLPALLASRKRSRAASGVVIWQAFGSTTCVAFSALASHALANHCRRVLREVSRDIPCSNMVLGSNRSLCDFRCATVGRQVCGEDPAGRNKS